MRSRFRVTGISWFQIQVSRAIILRELANCLYESGTGAAGPGERPPAANSGMAEAPAEAFSAAGGWGFGEGRRVRRAHRREARGEPADCQRAHEDPSASRARAGQTHQTMDVL